MTNQTPQSQEMLRRALRHGNALKGLIVAMVRDFDAADDIFQDTILEIARAGERFDAERDFLAWARGVGRNMVRRYWASARRTPAARDPAGLEAAAEAMLEEQDADAWEGERRALRSCMDRLSDRNRALMLERYGRNLKGPALAEKTGINPKSVRTTLVRLRQFLRRCIDAQLAALGSGRDGAR
jgi:RNA polymerase sigma-70 factor